VRVTLLGGFRVSLGSRVVREDDWRLKKAAGLVKLLALASDHSLHRDQILDALWPDLGLQAARNNLRQTLYAARKALAPDPSVASYYLQYRDARLALLPDGTLRVDADAFDEAAWAARRSKEPAAYPAAVDLYIGELLPGDSYEDWAEQRRQELRRTYMSLLFELAELHEERGEYAAAVEALREAVAEEPTREEAHAGLMRLHAISGDIEEALGQYERLEATLSSELDAKPKASSRHLRDEIANGRFPAHERIMLGEYERSLALLEESLALYRATGDENGIAACLCDLGWLALFRGDYQKVTMCLEDSIARSRDSGDELRLAFALNRLSSVSMVHSDLEESTTLLEESLAIYREAGDSRSMAMCLGALGGNEILRGDLEQATRLLEEAIILLREVGSVVDAYYPCLLAIAVMLQGSTGGQRGTSKRA